MRVRGVPGVHLGLLLAGLLLLSACGQAVGAQQSGGQVATVQRGDIEATVSATGSVIARADVALTIGAGGTLTEVLVKPGDRVKAGQRLAAVNDRDLRLQLSQAEANLSSAQAKYEQVKAGATPLQIEQAEASVRSAQAKYQQVANGATTAQDIASAEAAVRSAEAKLEAVRSGTVTEADLASAEAAVRSAEAKLAELRRGAVPADIDSAIQKVNQAKDNRLKAESQLSNAKEQARIAMEQAADALRSAQSAYGAAKLVYDEAVRTGKDPNISCSASQPTCNNKLTDAKLRQYKADYEAKQIAMSQAEQTLEARRLAYEDSKKQEIAGLQQADRQILDAQAQLDKLTAGPTPEQLVQAQASVDQARANLDKLRQPPKASDLVQAQAAVDQARASLEKLRRGPTAEDLAVAQATLDQAQATLADLKAGPKAVDLATALAAVKQAEAARDQAQAKLEQATLVAPFDGVVASVAGVPGQAAPTGATGLITLVDDSVLRVDIRVSENDLPRLALNQPARLTFDALPERTITGAVTFIAPKATVEQNVTAYIVSITFDPSEKGIRPGMTANVAVITDRKTNVLLVPSRAIRTVGRERVVEVRYKGLTFPVPVQVGMTGDNVTEIVRGLQEGDTVVINTAPTNRAQPNIAGPGATFVRKP
jgi:HlyD family secretion protein